MHANATANAGIFQKNEAATRAALIEPVLRALGWDTANVRMVEPEKSLGNELRVDYLLNDVAGKPYLVIEAKCLGSSLDKYGYVGKILGYALSLDVQTVCITDGIHWHIHSNLQKGKAEPITFTLTEQAFLPAATQLIQWLDAAHGGHGLMPLPGYEPVSPEKEPPSLIEATSKTATVRKVSSKQPKKKKPVTPSLDFIDLARVQLLSLQPGQKPKEIRLPNGTIKPIKTWKDILLEVCHFALATNPRIPVPLLDKAGKKCFLFSAQRPAIGSSFVASYNNKQLFIYTNYSAASCIANALYVTQQIPQNQKIATVAVRF
ncbi:hypothetical protein [Hymenobacter sp.]|uniref:hypothetical protein n=1 Tax=Hymenobacter sp. TaxID=1898978 RepID=UPI00286D5C9C|nr:hypothetical protein [Hymenobacter sp.]